MTEGDIYRKTDLGHEEVRTRKLRLTPRLRTMLILVDGSHPEELLREEGAKIGAPDDFLEQLVEAGLVELVRPLRDILR